MLWRFQRISSYRNPRRLLEAGVYSRPGVKTLASNPRHLRQNIVVYPRKLVSIVLGGVCRSTTAALRIHRICGVQR